MKPKIKEPLKKNENGTLLRQFMLEQGLSFIELSAALDLDTEYLSSCITSNKVFTRRLVYKTLEYLKQRNAQRLKEVESVSIEYFI